MKILLTTNLIKERRKAIAIVAVLALSCIVGYNVFWGIQYKKSESDTTYARQFIVGSGVSVLDTLSSTYTLPKTAVAEDGSVVSYTNSEELAVSKIAEADRGYLGSVEALAVDHVSLLAQNAAYLGWLHIPNSNISYPVYDSFDNEDFLHRNADGSYSYAGSIFMDGGNTSMDNFNTLIHGHNMKNGTMFGTLKNYLQQSFADSHPYIFFYAKDGSTRVYRVYSAYQEDTTDLKLKYGYDLVHYTKAERKAWIDLTASISKVVTNKTVEEVSIKNTKVLTLSTCVSDYTNSPNRTVVMAYLEIEKPAATSEVLAMN